MWASQNGHVEAVQVLIENGALIEAADKVRIHSHVHAPSLSSPPPPLTCARLPAGWAGRLDIADSRE